MTSTAYAPVQPPGGKLRIGVIGAGEISLYHFKAWQNAGCAVVAVCDTDRARAQARADAFGVPHVYTDAATMLAEVELDAVDVITWRDVHADMIRLAIAAGLPVLCQKPLARDLSEAEAIAREADGRIRLMVNENRRFAPHFKLVADWIAAGHVGDIRQVHLIVHRAGYIPDASGKRQAVERSPRMGTEPRLLIAESMIHQLDVLRYLLGEMDVIAARALYTEPDMPGETLATIYMETRAGAPVVCSGSFVAPGFGTTLADKLEIIGSRSSVIVDGMSVESRGAFQAKQEFDSAQVYQACFDGGARTFAQALLTGEEFPETVWDNLETMRLVEDAYASDAARPIRRPA